ncbi:MAG: fructose-bisphosphatase class III, partial [Aristaeellaceae bacterium]
MPVSYSPERVKYLNLLSEQFPTRQALYTEIINVSAVLSLPKGTEHFMSDLHGEYEAFCHIMNNCSGVVREKVNLWLGQQLNQREVSELCTLIYYPREKLRLLREEGQLSHEWYLSRLAQLVYLARMLSSKYTREKVRKAMPQEYASILDELLHAQSDEDDNQHRYHQTIMDTLIDIGSADGFLQALATLIKHLAVDRLHVVGDIFDRGPRADSIMDILMNHHSIDIEWGNHDILWMGAASGSLPCVAAVVRNSLSYNNTEILENGYGIPLRPLA